MRWFLFSGADACAQGHDCQHSCVSAGDSYLCKCKTGYILNADKKTCSRKVPVIHHPNSVIF